MSSDNWLKYSSFIPVTAEFRVGRFLGDPSWFSLATAAKFLLFLQVAILEGKLHNIVENWFIPLFLTPTLGKQDLENFTNNDATNTTRSKRYSLLKCY